MTVSDQGRPVAVLAHSYYEEDPRVRREAEALVASGRSVDVFALRRPGESPASELNGVRIRRLDVHRHQGAGLTTYLREYLSFAVRASWALMRSNRQRHYGLLHVHSLPDFLVFAGLPLRFRHIPIVLDLHEAMPEFYRTRFPRASNRFVHRLLLLQERASINAASAVITVNSALESRLVDLGVPAAKVTVILNSPSLALFDRTKHPPRVFASDGTVRLVYAGALSPTYELDVALRALAHLIALRPELHVRLEIYGRDFGEGALEDLANQLGIADRVAFHGRVPLEEVPAAIANADVGLAPTRQNAFTDFSLSTKIFEYGAMGKAVVASRLPMVVKTFPADSITTYTPGDPLDLAAALIGLIDDRDRRESAIESMGRRVQELAWEHDAARLVALVDRLAPPATG